MVFKTHFRRQEISPRLPVGACLRLISAAVLWARRHFDPNFGFIESAEATPTREEYDAQCDVLPAWAGRLLVRAFLLSLAFAVAYEIVTFHGPAPDVTAPHLRCQETTR